MNNLELEEIWPYILCFYPFYNSDGSNSTCIMLQDGQQCLDRRKTKTLLQAMARIFAADLKALRENYRNFLGHKGLVPLPLHRNLILVPFRVRRVQYKDHGATGYAVFNKVECVQPPDMESSDLAVSRIGMIGGASFECLEKPATIKKRLTEASQVQKEYSRFYSGRAAYPVSEFALDSFCGEETGKVVYHIHYHAEGLPSTSGGNYDLLSGTNPSRFLRD